jgi:hypothetical protein
MSEKVSEKGSDAFSGRHALADSFDPLPAENASDPFSILFLRRFPAEHTYLRR